MRRAAVALAIVGALGLWSPGARAGDGVALLRYMPEDINTYVVLDVAAAKGTPLFAQGIAALVGIMPAEIADQGAKILGPTTIDTIALGFVLPDNDSFVLVAEVDDAPGIIKRGAAVDPTMHTARYHGVSYGESDKTAIAAIDRHHLVLARNDEIEAAIDVALGKRPSAAKSRAAAKVRDAVAATDTRHDLWLALVPPDAMAAPLHAKGVDVTSVSLAAGISDALAVDGTILAANEASARTLFVILDKDKGAVPGMLQREGLVGATKSYDASRDGALIHVAFTLDKDDLAVLAAVVFHRHP